MIVVTAAIIEKDHKILITRRSGKRHLTGYWEFPGGKLDLHESEEECLLREIKEELNIEVEVSEYFMENLYVYEDKTVLLKAYFCKYLSGNIVLKDHDKLAWVKSGSFKNYKMAPADIEFVKHLERRSS